MLPCKTSELIYHTYVMVPISSLEKAVKEFKHHSVVVCGDLMLDEYHWCSVSRISPEAPVPVCSVTKTTVVPGGAANVGVNLDMLGSNVSLLGCIGRDTSGDRLIDLLTNLNISTEGVIVDTAKPTTLKSRIVAHQQHVARVDREDNSDIRLGIRRQLLDRATHLLSSAEALVISDYLKGCLPTSYTQKLIQLATQFSVPVVVDPKGVDYRKYKGATILTPNFSEFKAVTKAELKTEDEITHEAQKLIRRLQLEALLVTRSEKGMSLFIQDGSRVDISTQAREVFDITGAGDTVIATLSLGIASGLGFETSARLANAAAGVVVAKVGTSVVTPDELIKELSYMNIPC